MSWSALTARERDVVRRVAEGLSNSEIADDLGLSEQTIKFHLSHVLRKQHKANRVALAVSYVREVEFGSKSPVVLRRPLEGIPMSAPP